MMYWLASTAAVVSLLWATLLLLTGNFCLAGWALVLTTAFGATSAEIKLRKEERDERRS